MISLFRAENQFSCRKTNFKIQVENKIQKSSNLMPKIKIGPEKKFIFGSKFHFGPEKKINFRLQNQPKQLKNAIKWPKNSHFRVILAQNQPKIDDFGPFCRNLRHFFETGSISIEPATASPKASLLMLSLGLLRPKASLLMPSLGQKLRF